MLITGGTGDVGKALVLAFAKAGAKVDFQYSANSTAAIALARESAATPIAVDFADPSFAPPSDCRYDVLVNNAGVNVTSALTHEVSDLDWRKTLLINLDAPFKLARACLPHMIGKRWGRIINVSSIYGLRAVEGNLPYTISKHGLSGLTRTIAKEYARFGITANEVCPGPIAGSLMTRIAEDEARREGGTAADYLQTACNEIPAGRLANPEEVAALVVFLASPAASYLNGCSIPLDGGLIA